MAQWNLFDVVNSIILKFPAVVFSFYKHSNVDLNYSNYYSLIIIILIIITKSHNNYCGVGVMELCLLNLVILIDCFFV